MHSRDKLVYHPLRDFVRMGVHDLHKIKVLRIVHWGAYQILGVPGREPTKSMGWARWPSLPRFGISDDNVTLSSRRYRPGGAMLTNRYMTSVKNLPAIMQKIIEGTAPDKFTAAHLK